MDFLTITCICGCKVECIAFTNPCEKCGREHNHNGGEIFRENIYADYQY